MIQPEGSGVTWLAGLYRIEEMAGIRVPVFAILTREPGDRIRFIHDRMPVILPGEAIEAWIDPKADPKDVIGQAVTEVAYERAGT